MRGLVTLIAALSISGCASTGFLMAKPEVTLFGDPYPPKAEGERIEVFQTAPPDREYQEIARISCGDTDDNWNMTQILAKAREIGADGIIVLGRAGSQAVAVPIGGAAYGVSEEYGIVAVAIRFKQ